MSKISMGIIASTDLSTGNSTFTFLPDTGFSFLPGMEWVKMWESEMLTLCQLCEGVGDFHQIIHNAEF